MYKQNNFDKNDPMLDAIADIVNQRQPLQKEYADAARNAGKEARGLNLEDRKTVYKKHMRIAQQESGSMLPADRYVEFEQIANDSLGD